ncbi:hypothetical protein DL96DRAFT_1561795 [Flagelloscypha sp. PMI_526]|nr:hypothetical protein DL96DRAFT_1561795 [Flagelloscypha sp. PMI_526]
MADSSQPQVSASAERHSRRPRSTSIHESSISREDGHRRSQSRGPIVPPPGSAPVTSKLWNQKRPLPTPQVVPYGYPEGTEWFQTPDGWQRLKNQKQLKVLRDAAPSTAALAEQTHGSCSPTHFHPDVICADTTGVPRARSLSTHDSRRRSRSHSRSRSNQVAALDSNTPPLPPVPSRAGHQQKPLSTILSISSEVSEDFRRGPKIGGSETLQQDQERLGYQPHSMTSSNHSFSPHNPQAPQFQPATPQSLFVQQQLPVPAQPQILTASQKPLLKRMFGGLRNGFKDSKASAHPQSPPANHTPSNSNSVLRTNQRPRTKSMC